MTAADIRDLFRAWLARHGYSHRKAARVLGVTVATVENTLYGTHPPNATILEALGIVEVRVYCFRAQGCQDCATQP